MGLPLPMEPLASSTLQVFAKASTKTAGSRAITGEMVLKKDLTGIADEGLPAAITTHVRYWMFYVSPCIATFLHHVMAKHEYHVQPLLRLASTLLQLSKGVYHCRKLTPSHAMLGCEQQQGEYNPSLTVEEAAAKKPQEAPQPYPQPDVQLLMDTMMT